MTRHFPEEIPEFGLTKDQVMAARVTDKGPRLAPDRVVVETASAQTSSAKLRVHVLASGSKGNCVIVQGPEGSIMVDCGLSRKAALERMGLIGMEASGIVACLLTHEHTDHLSGIDVMSRHLGVPVYTAEGTAAVHKVATGVKNLETIHSRDVFTLAGIQVDTFPTSHDAADPFGMRFTYEGESVGLATDTGFLSGEGREMLSGCRILALESNHDPDMLRYGPYPSYLKARIAGDEGHLSNVQSQDVVEGLLCDGLECLVGMHLSETNNTPDIACGGLQDVVSRNTHPAKVAVAYQGRPVSIL